MRALAVLLRGFAADELVAAAALGVDLLVLGARAGGHLHRLLHKGVVGEVALRATCPVLICPTPAGAPVGAAA
ncbi:MAG: universal stress protein [Solirubrobacterales bacterium]